ncbi:hypothetical protein ACRAWD_30220 [Caulobacter segnis]
MLMVQNPTITLEGDAAATEQVIAAAKAPGRSGRPLLWRGRWSPRPGPIPRSAASSTSAAFAPDIGETVLQLASAETPGTATRCCCRPTTVSCLVDPAKFPGAFAAGVDPSLTRFMAASQVPWGLGAVQTKLTQAAWKDRPTYSPWSPRRI